MSVTQNLNFTNISFISSRMKVTIYILCLALSFSSLSGLPEIPKSGGRPPYPPLKISDEVAAYEKMTTVRKIITRI